ncbi:hypothetical protein J4E82_011501 [Alternaria postmessia]|uniref:uncharacterized protein n=1 Tax=Alternaria postmessia TaxID=1187938 RepID=UPI0022258289|nr:uncharacterized protein J4E82_011501 [Alternaria postmessia]KAI5364382.1 hypothetical protein J4E82_011501 [Alternaria postmessia]
MRYNESKLLDGPQNLDEAAQVIQHHTEKVARHGNQMAQEYNKYAEELRDTKMTAEELESKLKQKAQEIKDNINQQIDGFTEWLIKKSVRIVEVLHLNQSEIAKLGNYAEQAQGWTERIFKRVLNFIKWVFEKINEGITAVWEATKWVVQKVQDFVEDAICKIRQIFQTPEASRHGEEVWLLCQASLKS